MESLKARAQRLMDMFKLTPDKWEKVDEFQGRVCFICQKPQKSGNRLNTDHRHSDGLYRAHLCSFCNKIIGLIDRFWDILCLQRVLEFYRNPPAVQALGYEHFGWPGRVTTKKHRKMLKQLKKQALKGSS